MPMMLTGAGRAAPGGSWSPVSLPAVRAWFGSGVGSDFTDAAATIQATNGQAIYTRKDSVGAGSLQQATLANRPLLDSTGTPFADFDNDLMSGAVSYAQPTANGLCVVWVGTPAQALSLLADRWNFNAPQWLMQINGGQFSFSLRLVGATPQPAVAAVLGARTILIGEYRRVDNLATIQRNGGTVVTVAATQEFEYPDSIDPITLGGLHLGHNPYDGAQEALIICDPLSDADRTNLLAYYGF